jgi:excisionase family DNA binding protein
MSAIPGFYTVHEVAAIIGRSHSQVCRYIRAAHLPAKRVGREILVPQSAVKEFSLPKRGNPDFLKRKA